MLQPLDPSIVSAAVSSLVASLDKCNKCCLRSSPEREQTIGLVDYYISLLNLVTEQLLHATTTRSLMLRRHRNALVPIHRLPPEIFTSILTLVPGMGSTYDGLRKIAGVCKSWHKVVTSDPTLWSTIDILTNEDKNRISLFLRKSGNAFLRINLRSNLLRLADHTMLLQNCYRWRSLCIIVIPIVPIADFRRLFAPNLEILHIRGDFESDVMIAGLPEVSSPRSLDLEATYLAFWHFPPSMSSLHTLRIACRKDNYPTPAMFALILASVPNLTSLTLLGREMAKTSKPSTSLDAHYMDGPNLCPNLQFVKIGAVHSDLTAMLARRLSFANCHVICIDDVPISLARLLLNTDLAHRVGGLSVLVRDRVDRDAPEWQRYHRTLKVEGGSNGEGLSLTITTPDDSFLQEAIEFASLLQVLPIEMSINLHLDLDYSDPSLITKLLQLTGRTRRLECDIFVIAGVLEIPQDDSTWLLPELVNLTLHNEFERLDHETICDFLIKRWGIARSPALAPPRRLQRLSLRTQTPIEELMVWQTLKRLHR
ncbi:hypothetical protein FRB99_005680 [Tulasnella sp. 403]|nr:hypothetical protein FRB99_005680 [Tulasnella sp. 403]